VSDAKRPLLEEQEKLRAGLAEKESRLKTSSADLVQSRSELEKLREDNTHMEKVGLYLSAIF
jgi:septal ring factor EnvC (AmiA/AmiB activator)